MLKSRKVLGIIGLLGLLSACSWLPFTPENNIVIEGYVTTLEDPTEVDGIYYFKCSEGGFILNCVANFPTQVGETVRVKNGKMLGNSTLLIWKGNVK